MYKCLKCNQVVEQGDTELQYCGPCKKVFVKHKGCGGTVLKEWIKGSPASNKT